MLVVRWQRDVKRNKILLEKQRGIGETTMKKKIVLIFACMLAVVPKNFCNGQEPATKKDPLAPITAVLREKTDELDKKGKGRPKMTPSRPASPKCKTTADSSKKNEQPSPPKAKTAPVPPSPQPPNATEQHKDVVVSPVKAGGSDAIFSQFALKELRAEYCFDGPLALEFMKAFNIGGTEKSRILYAIFPGKEGMWNLKIDILDGNAPVLQYRVQMDSKANVIKERVTAIEYIEPQRTMMEKLTFRNRKKTQKKNIEDLTVSLEKQFVLGASKVLRRYKNGKLINELSVSPDEIITTLGQIVVFIGTVNSIPPEGLKLRWTTDGKPLPVLLKKNTQTGQGLVWSVHRADNTLKDELKARPFLRFSISPEKEFRYPDEIVMDINGTELKIVKK